MLQVTTTVCYKQADGDWLSFKEDRYGGVEVSAVATAAAGPDGVARFASELKEKYKRRKL